MVDTAALWVADLLISEATATKIRAAHSLEPADVRDEVVCRSGLHYVWDDDPERGLRAIVQIRMNGVDVYVVLYDAHHPLGDVYHLGSAYPVGSKG
jgi:hypothetical protein